MPYQGSCGAEDLLHCLGCRNVHPNRRTAAGGLAESWQQGWGGTLMGTRAGVCGRGTGKEAAGRRRAGGRARDRRRWAQHRERRWGRGDKRRAGDERAGRSWFQRTGVSPCVFGPGTISVDNLCLLGEPFRRPLGLPLGFEPFLVGLLTRHLKGRQPEVIRAI